MALIHSSLGRDGFLELKNTLGTVLIEKQPVQQYTFYFVVIIINLKVKELGKAGKREHQPDLYWNSAQVPEPCRGSL